MKSSRRTVSIALRSRWERRSPRRSSSPIFASRSRRRSSSLLTGWLGGGISHPSFIGLSDLRRPRAPPVTRMSTVRRGPRASPRAFHQTSRGHGIDDRGTLKLNHCSHARRGAARRPVGCRCSSSSEAGVCGTPGVGRSCFWHFGGSRFTDVQPEHRSGSRLTICRPRLGA